MLASNTQPQLNDSLLERAAQLLITPTALADLSALDARTVMRKMVPQRLMQGTAFIKEGEVTYTDFMMLVIEGEVMVTNEASTSSSGGNLMSVIGAGSIIGEMGLLDGEQRSATCTASTDVTVAILSRDALLELIKSEPAVAARLLLAISKRLSDRLREANRKIKILDGLSRALQQELDAAHHPAGSASASASRVRVS